jgi:RHS repeat-associated protein
MTNARTSNVWTRYTYDDIGQLKTAWAYDTNSTQRVNERFGYFYDAAGNAQYRTNNALIHTFNVNSMNQLTTVTRNGTMTVAGTTTCEATNVTVNTSNALQYADVTFASTNHTLSDGTNIFTAIGKDNLGRADTNIATVYLPATASFTFDSNGNLTYDGHKALEYDDENQLTRITATNQWKSEFSYDGKMRRRIRKEYIWQSSTWLLSNEVRYVYDNHLIVQERDVFNFATVTYTRGPDLSGSLEGAGGISGLLARTDNAVYATIPSNAHAYYYADANGNIIGLYNAQEHVMARYIYDPFGHVLSISGALGEANVYRFSSKEAHVRSGLVYYHYRYYDPNVHRWANRDPIQETAGNNLYGFAKNSPVMTFDAFGLDPTQTAEDLKKEIDLIQQMRDLAEQMIDNLENGKPDCWGVSSPVAYYCKCFRDAKKDCDEFAECMCVQIPTYDDAACKKRAKKACEIAKKILEACEKAKGKKK